MNLMLLSIFVPIILGAGLFVWPQKQEKEIPFTRLCMCTGLFLSISFVLAVLAIIFDSGESVKLFSLSRVISVDFKMDDTGKLFAIVMSLVWTLVGFFSFEYMKHEKNNKRYFGIYVIVLGILMGLCFSGNLVTYYAFYELMTISSFAMVLHNQSHEALMAGLKYLFYSFAGAYMVLFGIYFVYRYAIDPSMGFAEGGILDVAKATADGALSLNVNSASGGVLSVAMLLMIIGFSVKAGMFPMHGWLPTAHPVAPAPASAALSAIIVKSGVLGIIRVIYYIFGKELFDGSYVQKTVIVLSLITVFMGSMLAYGEKVLKKRLAYSTVSQVSYILFGIFMMNDMAFKGAMLHVAAHAAIKSTLFLCAGAIIYITGCTRVEELRGIGRKMPVMLWCYTIVSLGLVGIPPFGGFVSKWYLCVGALQKSMSVFSWLGPVVLLVSALLTAGYLLPITINGFLPGKDFEKETTDGAYMKASEPKPIMLIPIIILTAVSVIIGLLPEVLVWA